MDDAKRDEVDKQDQETSTQLETTRTSHKASRYKRRKFGACETRCRCALRDTGAGMERKPKQNQ